MWLSAPSDLQILADEVHVWRAELDRPIAQLQQLEQILSLDELTRARRFYFQKHRQRFIAGRGVLRNILSRYLNIPAHQIQFAYEARGKPFLVPAINTNQLCFNLSHSEDLALYAITQARAVGVDLEGDRSTTDVINLAEKFFSLREYNYLRSLSPQQQQSAFFRYWTCKEAYLKATGVGLAQLNQVEILLTPQPSVNIQSDISWSLFEITLRYNLFAAVAVAGQSLQLKYWEY